MSAAAVFEAQELDVRLGGRPILRGLDLCVRAGDLYGLLGRNGAGKTTAMRCMLGLLPRRSGSATVFGTDSARIAQVAHPIGVALDPPGLDDSLTVRQNLELARIRGGIHGGRGVDEVLALVKLAHRQHNRGDRLSHGQGRRAAVARALLGAPKLLVLDEPLSGLDPEGVEEMLALFSRLTREEGVTIVLSSHHLREVEDVCTRVGLIEEGRTLIEGETAQLLAEAGARVMVACADPVRAQTALAGRAGLLGVESSAEALQLAVNSSFDDAAALDAMVRADAGVRSFHREQATLVDVFRAVLARSAQGKEAA
ncbi:MAG: ABC transporter ATP-binding protein [Planctomycetota bacterium]|nr:ABC transporter ATP-binding protein [Planctomycetota bacterium]